MIKVVLSLVLEVVKPEELIRDSWNISIRESSGKVVLLRGLS